MTELADAMAYLHQRNGLLLQRVLTLVDRNRGQWILTYGAVAIG